MFGTFSFLVASAFVFRIIGVSSLVSISKRFIPEFVKYKDYIRLSKFVLSVLLLSTIIIIILLIFLVIFKEAYAQIFNINNFNIYLIPFIFYVVAGYFQSLTESLLHSLLMQKSLTIYRSIRSALAPAVLLYFLPVLNVQIWLYIEGSLILFIVIPCLIISIRTIRLQLKANPVSLKSNNYRKRIIRYGLFSSFDQIGQGIVGRASDYFIISSIGDQVLVGLYSFAYKMRFIVEKVIPVKEFFKVITPVFLQKYSTEVKDKEKLQNLYNFILKMILPIRFVPFIFFVIYGKSIINLVYDPKYIDAYLIACIIFASSVLVSFGTPVSMVITLYEKVEINLYSKVIIVFSIAAGILGMKLWGLLGIVIVTSIGNFLVTYMKYLLIRRKAPIVLRFREMLNYLYISIFVFVLFYSLNPLVNNLFLLIIFSILFFSVYILLLIAFHPFNNEDLIMLEKLSDSSKIISKIKPYIIKIYKLKSGMLKSI